jgi:hypothetical protein
MLTPQELFENDDLFEPMPQPDGSFRGAREMEYVPVVEKHSDTTKQGTNN